MASRYRKRHLLWFIPLVLLLLLALALGVARLFGWHWQDPGWRNGPTLGRLWWRSDGCLHLAIHGLRVQELWPLRLTLDSLSLPECPSSSAGGELALPAAPPFDVTIWALQYHDFPPLQVQARHRQNRWQASVSLRDSHLRVHYRGDTGHWRLEGQVMGRHLDRRLDGRFAVQGQGVWVPDQDRFEGHLRLLGRQVGLARGPRVRVAVNLSSEDLQLDQGQGSLAFSGGLHGQVRFRWGANKLVISPFRVSSDEGLSVALKQGLQVPLAGDSLIDLADLQGGPLVIRLVSSDLKVRARVPVTAIQAPHWPFQAHLDGHFRGYPFHGILTGKYGADGWGGAFRLESRLPQVDQGGAIRASGHWRWDGGLRLLPDTRLHLKRALVGETLIRPASLAATTPIRIGAGGVQGHFRLDAGGLVMPRWVLPSLNGDVTLSGDRFQAALRIPEWNARLAVNGRGLTATPRGRIEASTSLKPAISRGLGATTRAGRLRLSGHWQAGATPSLHGHIRGTGVALDWGGIRAEGLRADLAVDWRAGHWRIRSSEPLHLKKLDVGIPLTDISLSLHTDLSTWTFGAIQASLLGGKMRARQLVWPSEKFQPVVLTGIEIARLAALQSRQVVRLSGVVGGYVPLQLQRDSLAIREGRLANETPLTLSVLPTPGVRSLAQSSEAVEMVLDVISPLRINDFLARINMSAEGWLDAAVTIKGVNPEQDLPVVFHYTHRENVLDLLRSLRIGDRITHAVMQQATVSSPKVEGEVAR